MWFRSLSENTEEEKGTPAVLQTPELLEHILGFCEANDLMSCRQVSSLWRKSARRKWNRVAIVHLTSESKAKEFMHYVTETRTEKCYRNFLLMGTYIAEVPTQFWANFGTRIKVLKLCYYTIPTATEFRNIVFHWTPNMEELVLKDIDLADPERDVLIKQHPEEFVHMTANVNLKRLTIDGRGSVGISCMELLSRFPAIQAITVEGLIIGKDEIFQAINKIRRKYPEKLLLKHIDTLRDGDHANLSFNKDRRQVLTDPALNLEGITLCIDGKKGAANLRSILRVHWQSLQKIELFQVRYFATEPYMEPVHISRGLPGLLLNLTKVVLHSGVFSSLRFLEFTPNLITLDIHEHSADRQIPPVTQQPRNFIQNTKLRNCKEVFYRKPIQSENLQNLMESIPYVEKLGMILDNHKFSQVCQGWSSLVELTLYERSFVDDEGITGMSALDVQIINEEDDVPATVRRPNIVNLPKLVQLSWPPEERLSLGHCGMRFGINHRLTYPMSLECE